MPPNHSDHAKQRPHPVRAYAPQLCPDAPHFLHTAQQCMYPWLNYLSIKSYYWPHLGFMWLTHHIRIWNISKSHVSKCIYGTTQCRQLECRHCFPVTVIIVIITITSHSMVPPNHNNWSVDRSTLEQPLNKTKAHCCGGHKRQYYQVNLVSTYQLC